MSVKRDRALRQVMPWLATAALFLIWEAACQGLQIAEFILPSPSSIWDALVRYQEALVQHSVQTLITTTVGFGLAIGGGVLLGMLVGASSLIYTGLYPLLIAFNSIPKVALVPVFVIWFGIGTVPAILTAFIISFFPIVVNVATGLATIEPEMQDVMRSLGAKRHEIMRKVGIPRAMPYLFASLKVAITLSFVGSVISETVAANEGIGYLMLSASSRFDVPLVFAGLIVVAVMGVAMYAVCAVFERRMTGWAFRGQLVT
jgi:NitT/TauT family transport system permease protein